MLPTPSFLPEKTGKKRQKNTEHEGVGWWYLYQSKLSDEICIRGCLVQTLLAWVVMQNERQESHR